MKDFLGAENNRNGVGDELEAEDRGRAGGEAGQAGGGGAHPSKGLVSFRQTLQITRHYQNQMLLNNNA